MIGSAPWASDLSSVVAAHGNRPAVVDGAGVTIDCATLAGRAAHLAHRLLAAGVTPGAPVATAFANGIPAVIAATALRLASAADASLGAAQTDAERAYAIRLSGARHVITTADRADDFAALGATPLVLDPTDAATASLDGLPPAPAEAWGRIGFTSGTTGQPKAIITTHGARWIGNLLQRASLPVMPGPGTRILLMTPLVHGAGILTHAFIDCGATSVVLPGARMELALPLLRSGTIDMMFAPPTVLAKLVAAFAADPDGAPPAKLRLILTGTAPLLPASYARARALFGPVIRVTYGKSEINNPIAALSPAETDAYYAEAPDPEAGICVGLAGAGVEIAIRDEDGHAAPPGAVGEVHLRGRHMSSGHVTPDGVFHKLPPDGFHATGDYGRIDARSRLHLVGRVADVIKSGGYKIHPDEIERVLAGTAAGGAVAVATLPSDYWGEVIVAVAETDDQAWPDRARAALSSLARPKHPRALLMWPELPRNAQGKIMRRLIRDELLRTHVLHDGPYPTLERRNDVV
jgi:acyl-CoA synthetase (AMP-forming)/AMP-acid ligase II